MPHIKWCKNTSSGSVYESKPRSLESSMNNTRNTSFWLEPFTLFVPIWKRQGRNWMDLDWLVFSLNLWLISFGSLNGVLSTHALHCHKVILVCMELCIQMNRQSLTHENSAPLPNICGFFGTSGWSLGGARTTWCTGFLYMLHDLRYHLLKGKCGDSELNVYQNTDLATFAQCWRSATGYGWRVMNYLLFIKQCSKL